MSSSRRRKPCLAHLSAEGCGAGSACGLEHLDASQGRGLRIAEGLAREREAQAARAAARERERAAAEAEEGAAEAARAAVEAARPVAEEVLGRADVARVEEVFVEEVYDAIAPHFSDTRHSPWPLVAAHLADLPPGSLVADIGCGNGKYMGLNPELEFVGVDKSRGLLATASGGDRVRADCIDLPLRSAAFDAAISIAVVHHLRTDARRAAAIDELLRIVRVGGTVLVTVWAREQESRVFDSPDELVPWKLQPAYHTPAHDGLPRDEHGNITFYRYYHLFDQGELEALLHHCSVPAVLLAADYDRDNWYAVFKRTA